MTFAAYSPTRPTRPAPNADAIERLEDYKSILDNFREDARKFYARLARLDLLEHWRGRHVAGGDRLKTPDAIEWASDRLLENLEAEDIDGDELRALMQEAE